MCASATRCAWVVYKHSAPKKSKIGIEETKKIGLSIATKAGEMNASVAVVSFMRVIRWWVASAGMNLFSVTAMGNSKMLISCTRK